MTAIMFMKAHGNRMDRQKLQYSDFPYDHGELNMLFISDIHRRRVSEKLLAKMPKKPDLICIGGDLTEKGVPLERIRRNVRRLGEEGPVVMVLGNNDPESDILKLKRLLKQERVKLLENQAFSIPSKSGKNISLLGVSEMKFGWDKLDLALNDSKNADFRILLCHNPDIDKQIKEETGIRLVLSGHTHGGQIRLLGFGLYEKGKLHKKTYGAQLISNGYGTTQLPLRLGAPAEAHFITITADKVD
ncbi:metallophosphoesterase [Metabacillus sp. KIGAM252]|uniref:Metallophosphoesterase n=2 Tax=Metabacillus flavus TaxID=2823519 RepID=A0ABS5LFH3_9BACI|nr:metallophosphoesterase [Metabacillus flavus]